MKTSLRCFLTIGVFFCYSITPMASTTWPAWESFKKAYISDDGRVIDNTSPKHITTSEGQSYALFFALVANDEATFDKLLLWTQDNLAKGSLKQQLPAWLWGARNKHQWGVLDSHSASDADVWIAYDLLEAGRLWNNSNYTLLGTSLLLQIQKQETMLIPTLGMMLMPGNSGFIHDDTWTLNPSYLPIQLFRRFALVFDSWHAIEKNSIELLLQTAPNGFAPNWVVWKKGIGWQPASTDPNIGSYDAIRVYLWLAMLSSNTPQYSVLLEHFLPMATLTSQLNHVPEKINIQTRVTTGIGSNGFLAALLPLIALNKQPNPNLLADKLIKPDDYYSAVLMLFSQGFLEHRYHFNQDGLLER